MFTGIIEALGAIADIRPRGADQRIKVATGKLDLADVKIGDSIATNGVCLTVVEIGQSYFSADVSVETIKRSGFANYRKGQAVNLEKAMLPTSRFGGHIVSGHVDGVGSVNRVHSTAQTWEVWIDAPANLAKYLAEKGSITVDGVSLTVNAVDGAAFKLTLVPHTLAETIIQHYQGGTQVNLEVDVVARYLERLMLGERAATSAAGISLATLADSGYLK